MVLAQKLNQSYRYEEELKTSDEGYTVISLRKEGLAMIRDLDRYTMGKKTGNLKLLTQP